MICQMCFEKVAEPNLTVCKDCYEAFDLEEDIEINTLSEGANAPENTKG